MRWVDKLRMLSFNIRMALVTLVLSMLSIEHRKAGPFYVQAACFDGNHRSPTLPIHVEIMSGDSHENPYDELWDLLTCHRSESWLEFQLDYKWKNHFETYTHSIHQDFHLLHNQLPGQVAAISVAKGPSDHGIRRCLQAMSSWGRLAWDWCWLSARANCERAESSITSIIFKFGITNQRCSIRCGFV